MKDQLTIIATIYEIERWSNFDKVKTELKESLGNTIFSKMIITEPRKGYMQITPAQGCESRIKETIQYEMPLADPHPVYSDGQKKYSEFYFKNKQI